MLFLSSSPPYVGSGSHSPLSLTVRWRLVGGLSALILLLALPALSDVWRVNQAGILLNRYEVTRDPAALLAAADTLGTPRTGAGSPSYWRTYGAVAVHRPSETAYQALEQADRAVGLDRIGELWLAEIASHTGHWARAEEAYSRFDATNVLVDRGDQALQEGDVGTARHWYLAASSSVRAAIQREAASRSEPSLPGAQAAPDESIIASQGNRAIPLMRIGRGLLTLESVGDAIPILELAYSEMQIDPPGTREQQAIRFSLAQALVLQDLGLTSPEAAIDADVPEDPAGEDTPGRTPGTPGGATAAPTVSPSVRARIDELASGALAVDETGWAHQQVGDLLRLAGDDTQAAAHYYRAIDLDPRLTEAYLSLGDIRRRAGLAFLAREVYADGHEALPADPTLAAAWAIESYRTLTPEVALPRLEEAAKTETTDPYVFAYLGDAYLTLGRPDEALQAYSEGLSRTPEAEPLLSRLARLVADMEGWPLP